MIAALLSAAALGATPAMPGDPHHLPAGSDDTLRTPALLAQPGFSAAGQLSYARNLISELSADGTEQSVLSDALALHLGAAWGLPGGDLTVSIPAYVHLGGTQLSDPGSAVGDLSVAGRAALTPWLSARLGASLPTGDASRLASYGTVTGSAGLIVGGDAGRLHAGYLLTPSTDTGTESFDDLIRLDASRAWALGDGWGLSTELGGQLRRQPEPLQGATAEAIVGLLADAGARRIHGGLGLGLLPGAGTPTWRVLLEVQGLSSQDR